MKWDLRQEKIKIESGERYQVKKPFTNVFTVKVVRIKRFKVFCKWTVHDWDEDYIFEDCGWISKRRFICKKEDW